MAGVSSINRNLDTEDTAYARAMLDGSEQPPTGEEMRIMAAGDVTVYPKPPATPLPVPATGKPTSTLAKAALAAALVGFGAGGGIAIPWVAGMFEQPTTTQITIE